MPTRNTPPETSTRLSRSTSMYSSSKLAAPRSRSPNATPVPTPSTTNKRLSSSIPALAGTRRTSAPLISRRNLPVSPSPARQNTAPATPSLTGSIRSIRSSSLYLSDSPPQEKQSSTHPRITSMQSQRSFSTADSPTHSSKMSPQLSKTLPQTSNSNSPKRTTPQKTPQKGVSSSPLNGHGHGRQQTPRNGSTSTSTVGAGALPGVPWSQQGALTRQSASLLSDSPASLNRKFTGQVDSPTLRVSLAGAGEEFYAGADGGGWSVWEGDDTELIIMKYAKIF
ncbi:hypothetical protein BD410DRAFT_900426 [Rickenella mellea]|uniref:Uncharacterized protein n=1 Tax=Rickenella mellea TaxID=50990 RepID=A0A4Y7PUI2_9AGAM|nr:hypothetical protein BD410DRAFT_900426 [Rickenella mellea]